MKMICLSFDMVYLVWGFRDEAGVFYNAIIAWKSCHAR